MKLNGILFVHIPRTGGTHFEKLLGFKGHSTPPRCGSALYGSNREELMGWDKEIQLVLTHLTYEEMLCSYNVANLKSGRRNHENEPQTKTYTPVHCNEKLIKVSIIRNPYHRTASLFGYFGGPKKWGSFKSFLDHLEGGMINQYIYKPQYKFITLKGGVVIDNLIRFENYKTDTENFKAKYNLNFNVTFDTQKQLKKSEANFAKYYKDEILRRRVEKIYQKDFELFGYPYGSA